MLSAGSIACPPYWSLRGLGRPNTLNGNRWSHGFGSDPRFITQGGNMNIRETAPRPTELEKFSTRTDTRDYLAKATPTKEKLKDWLVVDVDAHVNETAFWSEVTDCIDNDVLRYIAEAFRDRGPAPGLLNANGPLYQDVAGRIMHQQKLAEPTPPGLHRQVQLSQRAMDAMGIDYMVVFPTPMLSLGMHPQVEAERALGGREAHRLQGGVPAPDAVPRHASAGRCRGRARHRL